MENKKSISLKTIFIIWLIICYIYNFINIVIESAEGLNIFLYLKEQPLNVLAYFVFSIIPTVLTNWWILVVIFIIKRANKKVEKENLSEIDFKQYEGYYREILNEYSPAEIEYIDNLKCDEMTTIVATLLKLELLGKIKINENNIEIISYNTEDLRKTEKYIFKAIKDGKVKIECSGYVESYAQDEGVEDCLIEKFKFGNKDTNGNKNKRNVLIIVLFIFFALLCNNVELINGIENGFIRTFLTVGAFLIPIGMSYMIFVYPISKFIYLLIKGTSYIRTDKGKEINEKIEGLKNYIVQYSFLETKQKEELILWEDYLIYSVIFKTNTKIIEDISKLIEIEYETGRVYFSNQ